MFSLFLISANCGSKQKSLLFINLPLKNGSRQVVGCSRLGATCRGFVVKRGSAVLYRARLRQLPGCRHSWPQVPCPSHHSSFMLSLQAHGPVPGRMSTLGLRRLRPSELVRLALSQQQKGRVVGAALLSPDPCAAPLVATNPCAGK